MTEAVLDPPWKALLLHDANGVEVVVASVLRRRLRVQGDGMFQTKLADNDLLDLLLARREPEGDADCPEVREVLALMRRPPAITT